MYSKINIGDKRMNITSFVFSPTGGTSRVAGALTSVWHDVHYTQIDLTKSDYPYENIMLSKDEVCYISFPVYEGRVPKVVLDRLARVKVNGARLVMVAVYGNRAIDDALLEMKQEATTMGFRPIAAVGAVAEHSILRQHATGRPDKEDLRELEKFGEIIKERILNGECSDVEVPGKMPYCVINTPGTQPTADDRCNRCGVCSMVCPVGAISKEKPNETNHEICIACMRCVSVCPKKARSYEKATVEKISRKLARFFEGRKTNQLYM